MVQKTSIKEVCELGFSRWCSVCPGGWGWFSRCLRKRREHHLYSLTARPLGDSFLSVTPGRKPGRPICHCPRGSTHSLLRPLRSPYLDLQAASVSPLTLACAENQFKAHKKVAHLSLDTSGGQSPWPGSLMDHLVMESWGQAATLPSQLAVASCGVWITNRL